MDLRDILEGVATPTSYKLCFISNDYREPAFREIERVLKLTRPEIVSLIFLCYRDGITITDICRLTGNLKPNISRAAIALQKKGLIDRRAQNGDQRRQLLYVTPAGRAMHDTFMPGLAQREADMLACLSQEERKQFEGLLRKLCAHSDAWKDRVVLPQAPS